MIDKYENSESTAEIRSILIVDDEQDYAKSLADLLKSHDYNVSIAHTVKSAKDILSAHDIDLALIDIRLGNNNGIELIPELIEIKPDISCVLNTAYASVETAVKAIQSGADDYLQKGIPLDDLFIALERCYGWIKLRKEKAATENKLRHSEERLQLSLDIASDGSWDWNIETGEVVFSDAWIKSLGYNRDEAPAHFSFWESIVHPEDLPFVMEALKVHFENNTPIFECEYRIRTKSGDYRYNLARSQIVERDEEGNPIRMIGTDSNISERKQAEAQLSYHATHDDLTGLVNRREFERRTTRLIATAKKDSVSHALCYLDLDQFKIVNDTCGHVAGDELLRQLSDVLSGIVRKRDTLARLGGDEFGVLMEHCSLDQSHRVAKSLLKAIQEYHFSWEGQSFIIGASLGLVPITELTQNLTELLKDADAACYIAKDTGRNRVHVFHNEDTESAQRHGEMQWVARLHRALEEDRFCLYAQNIEPLDGSADKYYELLVRMIGEDGQLIAPNVFMPAAERYNLIEKIDRWVLEKIFRLLADNSIFLKQVKYIFINLSGQSITEPDFLDFIFTSLDESGLECEKFCFEITETAAISNLTKAKKFISTLKGMGCRFSLDDFGSGLSSFAYLKNLPVDYLKIDGMFVKDIVNEPINHAMVKSINEIGHVMGMQTIAEFVEDDIIKGMLKEIGVNFVQGFGIAKPQPFIELLNRVDNVTDIKRAKSIDGEQF